MKQIVGKRLADYKGRDGEQKKGVELYFMGVANGVEGFRTGDVYIAAGSGLYDVVKDIPVGAYVNIFNDSRGRLEDIEVLKLPEDKPEPQEAKK